MSATGGYYLDAGQLVLPAGVSIGTNTKPYTLDQVASVIFEVSAEIEGIAAAAGYAVPVSTAATVAYAQMQRAIRNGVYGIVMDTLFANAAPGGSQPTRASSYTAAYAQFKKDIKSGDLVLVGAARDTGSGGRAQPRTGGLASAQVTMWTRF